MVLFSQHFIRFTYYPQFWTSNKRTNKQTKFKMSTIVYTISLYILFYLQTSARPFYSVFFLIFFSCVILFFWFVFILRFMRTKPIKYQLWNCSIINGGVFRMYILDTNTFIVNYFIWKSISILFTQRLASHQIAAYFFFDLQIIEQ